jgi:ketosteroid isomerase-like protein
MSQENVEIVRRLVRSFNDGDIEGVLDSLDPAIEWRGPEVVPEPGPYFGKDAVEGWMRGFLDAWEAWRADPGEVIDGADSVVVEFSHSARAKGSGIEVSDHDFHLFRLRDRKITRWFMYEDRAAALAAAGLSE